MRLKDYDLIVFDVDGTLYFQNELRLIMIKRLVGYYALHPHKFKDLFVIKNFRSIREKALKVDELYDLAAKKSRVSVERAESVIKKWIYDNPLDAVRESRDSQLIEIIDELKEAGKTVAIWSDYEADDKLKAMGINCEYVYTAEQERVGELKPSPKGLKLVMNDLGIDANKTLMVGDRMVKDGEAAKAAGVDYIILDKSKKKRSLQLNNLK